MSLQPQMTIPAKTNERPCIVHQLAALYFREARALLPGVPLHGVMLMASMLEINSPSGVRDLASHAKLSPETVRRTLARMEEDGLLVRDMTKKYSLSVHGAQLAHQLKNSVLSQTRAAKVN
ncbi:MAG: hypothetical protein CML57_09500 [Rhodobacteraceae bacterium]|jgi:Transcriptional regulator|nr:hypothetical protein [Paracoccaceae bacterium]|tara:strand:- start:2434 stop:2796 length:363 start_codon:yes stop_codon:yes gene_type:complete